MLKKYLLAGLWAIAAFLPSNANAGRPVTATIGDYVWRDLNSNGIQDASEAGLSNVYVQLETSAGGYVNAVFTNSNGGYSFTNVAAGSYRVRFANPGGFFVSDADKGGDDNKDSDADLNGYSPVFTVTAGQVITNLDCGFRPQGGSTCALTIAANAGAPMCNDNGTPNNSSDDFYTVVFTASVTSNPNNLPTWGYKVQINNRTFYGMYGMPTAIGPIAISAGVQAWTLTDDDNPTCTATGSVTPPSGCSNGGTCVASAVRAISNTQITCGTPGNDYGFWFAGLTTSGLSKEWVWDNGNFIENSNGTAHVIGVISNKLLPNAKFAVDITLTGRTFTAMVGSPKTDAWTCAGTNTSSWYYYAGVSGQLIGISEPGGPSELAGGAIEISNVGPKPQFGTGASLRNATANGGSTWLTYIIKMQPANINLQFLPAPAMNAADINIQLSGAPLANCVTPPTCSDVTSGGQIGLDEAGCSPFNPAAMSETVAPAGGSGAFEYVWLSSTTACPTSASQQIVGATGASYDPGVISATTWYVRCVKRAGCPDFSGANHESNCIKKEVKTTGCGGGGPDCTTVTITGGTGSIAVGNLSAPIVMVQAYNASWAQVFACSGNCATPTQNITGLAAGIYYVKVDYLTAGWAPICNKDAYVTVGGGQTGVLTLSQPSNITVSAAVGATTAVVNYTAPTASTTCAGGATNLVRTAGPASGSAFPIGTTTITYTATDNCGNTKTVSFTVTVNATTGGCNDVTSGGQIGFDEIACPPFDPAAMTETAAPAGGSGAFEYVWLSSTTGCPTLASQQIAGATGASHDPGVASATTWYVRCVKRAGCPDFSGANHESNCIKKEVQTVGCGVGTPDCNAITITPGAGNITIGGLAAPIVVVQVFNASWAQVFSQNYMNSPGTLALPSLPAGQYFVKVNFLTAGWASICNKEGYFTVGGGSTGVLMLSQPANISVTAASGASSAVVTFPAPTASTTCAGGATNVTQTAGPASGSAFPIGTTTITYQATDNCGNVKTVSFTVTVNATNPQPTLSINDITVNENAGTATLQICLSAFSAASTTVNVSTSNGSAMVGSDYSATSVTVTIPANTLCANFTVPILDDNINEPTEALNVTLSGASGATIADGSGTVTILDNDQVAGPDCNAITITAGTGSITVSNLTAPIVLVQAFNASWAQVFTQTYTTAPGTVTIPGLATGTYYVKIDFLTAGWQPICSKDGYFPVTGGQTAVLTLSQPANISVTAAQGATSAVVTFSAPTASTTCAGGATNVTQTAGPASGSAFPIGTTTITYQATDNCGNVKTVSFTVTVNASASAVLTLNCASNITVTAAQGAASAIVNYSAPTASTTCPGGAVTLTRMAGPASGSAFSVGTTTVTYTATDNCGNSKTCSFTVTVTASAAAILTLTCGNNVSATAACGMATAVVNYLAPTASTTCVGGAVNVTRTAGAASGSAFAVGTTTITYQATDNCGSVKTCSFTVTVNAATLGAEKSFVKHSFNSCYSNTGNSSPTDYSEFTPTVAAGVTASIVTKNDGTMHSCNPGPNSTLAICTQSNSTCTAGYGKALAFTTNVSGSGSLTTLRFYVRSADPSLISGGNPMANNKLTKVAVRIMQGTTVVYENTAVPITSAWVLQTLTLPTTINFNGATTFKVELAGYCPATTHQPNYIWDLDELELLGKDCNATPAPACSIQRTVSNSIECQNNTTYSIWINSIYYQLTGGVFTEYNDGTAKLTGSTSLGAVNVNFAGRTFTGTAVPGACYTPNTANWYYYAGFNGTVGTYNIVGNSMHKFQIGMGGNNQNSASYGGSGWFDTSTGLAGDINIKLSGDRTTLSQMLTNCSSNCVSCAISLSQDRLTFNAYRSGLDVKLKWLSNTGDRNEFFDLERSTDGGQTWSKIDRVNGQGPANEMLYFDGIDRNPAIGDNIYRLSLVWKDGSLHLSDEQTVHFDAIPTLALYPNPAADEVFIDLSQFAGGRLELKMFNALGVLVRDESIEKVSLDPHRIDISTFGAGQFSISILPENERPQIRKLVIAR